MEVTIFQINGRVHRFSNVYAILEKEEGTIIDIWLNEGDLRAYKTFKKDLIAQIKIGGQHEYKKEKI